MSGFAMVLRDLGLLIARVAFGTVLVLRGWRRWTAPAGMQGHIDYLKQFGTPQPEALAWGSTLLEIVGGVFLIFGLLTPLIALTLVIQQGMIIAWTKWFRGLWQENGGYEYNLLQACLALLLLVFGAGRVAIDRLFRRTKTDRDPLLDDDYGTNRNRSILGDDGPA